VYIIYKYCNVLTALMIITLEYKNLSYDSGKKCSAAYVSYFMILPSFFFFLFFFFFFSKFRFTIKINVAERRNVIVPRHNDVYSIKRNLCMVHLV